MPHSLIEDKFGRRPRPRLDPELLDGGYYHRKASAFEQGHLIALSLRNSGRAIARDLGFALNVEPITRDDYKVFFDEELWQKLYTDGLRRSVVAPRTSTFLYPGGTLLIAGIYFYGRFKPPEDVEVTVEVFADGIQPVKTTRPYLFQGR
jgi:hypothetical protein